MGFVIVLEPENRPRVVCDFTSEGDELRMLAWLDQRPELAELLALAVELAAEEPAA